jgi:hypothetical protein
MIVVGLNEEKRMKESEQYQFQDLIRDLEQGREIEFRILGKAHTITHFSEGWQFWEENEAKVGPVDYASDLVSMIRVNGERLESHFLQGHVELMYVL